MNTLVLASYADEFNFAYPYGVSIFDSKGNVLWRAKFDNSLDLVKEVNLQKYEISEIILTNELSYLVPYVEKQIFKCSVTKVDTESLPLPVANESKKNPLGLTLLMYRANAQKRKTVTLEDYFKYQPPTNQKRKDAYTLVNEAALAFANVVSSAVGDTDCKKMSIMAIQQARMFANQGVAIDELISLEE